MIRRRLNIERCEKVRAIDLQDSHIYLHYLDVAGSDQYSNAHGSLRKEASILRSDQRWEFCTNIASADV